MFENKEINLTLELLNNIINREPQDALISSKNLLEKIFGKKFSENIEINGLLRYNSLAGQEDNIHYWGLLYEGATTSGIYENFSLVAFPQKYKIQIKSFCVLE